MLSARLRLLIVAAATAVVAAPAANPSELLDRDASGIGLAVNGKGEALVSYTARGKAKKILVWGAVDAIPPVRGRQQVAFKLDYSGGYGKYKKPYWKTFGTTCLPYDGPPLDWLLKACKAPDGSYWALQGWQRALPNYGLPASGQRAATELRLSHWTAPMPVLAITTDTGTKGLDHLYGSFTHDGRGVHGFRSTPSGVPLDTFGRNIYVDTFDSAYGSGWKRENSFLTHGPDGTFCYLFAKHGPRPNGNGTKYRATVIGPGVTPDVMWSGTPAGTPALTDASDRAGTGGSAITDAADRATTSTKPLNDPLCS